MAALGAAADFGDGETSGSTSGFFAFSGGFTGGVSVATAAAAGTNKLDLVLGGGAGQQSMVKIVQADTLAMVSSITAFDPAFMGGVFVG